ncbi:hypothetical protein ABZP36_021542 [Zizania latifolia]
MSRGAAAIGGRSGRWASSTGAAEAPPQVEYGRRTWTLEPAGAAVEGEYSPGLLDLHSVDTELLTDMPVAGSYDTNAAFYHTRDQRFNDYDPSFGTSKQNNVSKSSSVAKIKVVVRKRPLNKKEISRKEEDVITIDAYSNSLTVHETKLKVDLTEYVDRHEFVFDAVLDDDVSNDEVYRETVESVVPAIFQQTKATCFAYGQTGSGKTYTMQPLPLKASHDILSLMHYTYRNQGFQLFVSFFEIYGGKLFDLLNQKRKLCMREDGKQQVCIVGLKEYRVSDVEMIKELIERGNACRSTGTTGANEESSRSHAILQLVIKKLFEDKESKPSRVVGKLSFIDLAGSERGADTTDNDKQTRIEGAEINKSLLALKECIRALDNDQVHIPFRGSKLTEVLRDSFIGNSRTVMISCISPNSGSCEHTLNTLRYADRVKSLSKGGSKKDAPPALASMRESSPGPPPSNLDYSNGAAIKLPRFGSKQIAQDDYLSSNIDHVPSAREVLLPSYSNHIEEPSRSSLRGSDNDLSEEGPEQAKPLGGNKGTAPNVCSTAILGGTRMRKTGSQILWNNIPEVNGKVPDALDGLDALLKEEEDLVMAHREQVEETINVLREEMELLEEADLPGNQLDEYITRMNAIISKKAAGLMNLQARLASFQQRLAEQHVLVTPLGL